MVTRVRGPLADSEEHVVVEGGPDGPVVDEQAPSQELALMASRHQRAAYQASLPGRQRRWETEWVPLSVLIPADYNPRVMPDEEMKALKKSLEEFGQVDPIIVNTFPGREGIIVGGHQRRDAQHQEGWLDTFVLWWYGNPTKEKQMNLALNRVHGEWEPGKLAEVIHSLDLEEADLTITGFTQDELDSMRAAYDEDGGDGDGNLDDDEFDGEDAPTRVQPGELWAIGDHRLLCADATDPRAVKYLMAGERIDFVFTSPPYNVGVQYAEHDDETVTWDEYGPFLARVIRALMPHLAKGRIIGWNIGSSPKTFPHRQYCLMEDEGLTYVRQLIWKKVGVPVPLFHNTRESPRARHFTPNYTHELVGLFSLGDVQQGGPVSFGDLLENDVFTIHQTTATTDLPDDPTAHRTGAQSNLETRAKKAHPAAFPVALPGAFIAHLADMGAIVYEPFCGSGSTIVASHRLGRRCYAMELTAKYCDIILARLEKELGVDAECLGDMGGL